MLEFNEERHEYKLDGVVFPSVTTIIKPLENFVYVDPDILRRAADFGKAVHTACELHDLNDLDEATLDPSLVPYLDACKRFLVDTGARNVRIEQRMANENMRFAGTIDRECEISRKMVLVDIKSVAVLTPPIGVQLAAYKNLLEEGGARYIDECAAVQLRGDGIYKYKAYKDPHDWPTFVSLLTIHNWRKKHE